ncbi:DUF4878 domain-containing protein [Campylobacter jejuni]|nr:DUF4878 domain-containing protein [Campylobacter jejuni]EAL8420525.1 DUF4878 domain-containing protein [Campylobacter jejuni]EHD2801262.1 DUF4878 domain-containing protein [Campylobacter jejuni]EHT9381630.1 DUF4878 domain-containing protein [Campylobacter jejuni]EIM0285926.1 DUF4878 domain-containing protein [Campylobacter jejuni]
MACGSSNPEDLAKNFTKDLYSGDTKSVMSYIDLSEAKSDEKKHLLVIKSLKLLLKMQPKQKEWVVLKIFKLKKKQSIKILLKSEF